MMYAERYAENDKRLEELAKKQIALEQELADTTVTAAQQKADASETFTAKTVVDIKAQAQALKDHAKEMKQAAKDAEHLKKALESIRVKLLQIEASNAWDVQNMSDWVRAGNQAIEDMEREFGIYMDGVYRDIENTDAKVVEDVRKTTDLTYDLWMRAMNRVEEGIADTFYEVFTGQFDSIEDAFDSMLDSMLRMLAEWAAAATMFYHQTSYSTVASLPHWSRARDAELVLLAEDDFELCADFSAHLRRVLDFVLARDAPLPPAPSSPFPSPSYYSYLFTVV